MNRKFQSCVVLTLLAVAWTSPAQNQTKAIAENPRLCISVHDYADVPPAVLIAAEGLANRIFQRAGLETTWLNCGPKVENVQSKECYVADTTHLMLKVLRHAMAPQVRDRSDVLGVALLDEQGIGYFGYTYYDRVQKLAGERKLGPALLGNVFAHEIGHLLLQSNSHSVSGIMRAHWNYDELVGVAEGVMSFVPSQSKIMQDRLRARQSGLLDLEPIARQQNISATSTLSQEDGSHQHFVCNTGYTLEKCDRDMAVFRKVLEKYPIDRLGEWTWVLIRSEDWKSIKSARRLDPNSPAFSYYLKRQTFLEEALVADVGLRRADLVKIWGMSIDKLLEFAVSHELGHALCNERGEAEAERVARSLRQDNPPSCRVDLQAKRHR